MGKDLSGLRSIAARRSGMRCHYCKVPTAAEIEHMQARAEGGSSWMNNLVLSCPLCNKRKGKRSAEEFIQSDDWKLPPPPLADNPAEMLQSVYGWSGPGVLSTRSRNARIREENGQYFIEIRPGKKYPWKKILLEGERTSVALWVFLERHFTPKAK